MCRVSKWASDSAHEWTDTLRRRWGCDDKPGKIVICEIGCVACAGMDPDCELCSGSGKCAIRECPNKQQPAWLNRVLEAYLDLSEGRGWPSEGGPQDQTRFFKRCVAIMDGEKGRITAELREEAEEKSRRR